MKGLYFGNNRILIEPLFGGSMLVTTDDLSITPWLVAYGSYELPLHKFMQKEIKKGDVVFDVGANQGYFTLLMAAIVGPQGRVISYEANPKLHLLVRDNVNINYAETFTEVYNKAVYSEKKELTFYAMNRFLGNSSIYNDYEIADCVDTRTEIKIEAEPLDIYVDRFPSIKLIKIDIEGAEYDAFLGMKQLLKAGTVENIVVEWNNPMLGDRAPKLLNLVMEYEHQYGFFGIDNEGGLVGIDIRTIMDIVCYPFLVMKKMV
jgi:FkbM family methyltransferase